jgi:hypothetical protein
VSLPQTAVVVRSTPAFGPFEDRLVAIERDLAVVRTRLDSVPTMWTMAGLILPRAALPLVTSSSSAVAGGSHPIVVTRPSTVAQQNSPSPRLSREIRRQAGPRS